MLQPTINGLASGSLIAILALGFAVLSRSGSGFHLAHGAVFTVAAVVFQSAVNVAGLFWVASVVLAFSAAILLGLGIEFFIYRPLRAQRATPVIMLMASLATYVLLESIVSLAFGNASREVAIGPVRQSIAFLGARVTRVQAISVISTMALTLSLTLWLRMSQLGKNIRALGIDPQLSEIIGIDARIVRCYSMCIGSFFAGVAGVLSACDTVVFPTMGLQPLFAALVAVVVGRAAIANTVLVAIGIGLLRNISALWISAIWQDTLVFLILVVFLAIFPHEAIKARI